MTRSPYRRLGLLVGALLLFWTELAAAFSYFEASPQGTIGLSQPTISQQLHLGPGERIASAELWLDGQKVYPTWDETGRLSYRPAQPLEPGPHQGRLVVQVAPSQPGHYYAPLESLFTFTVAPGAVAELAGPGSEEQRALAVVNQYRQAAGLAPLAVDPRLAAAARSHAHYLVENPDQVKADGHREVPGQPGFTGETVGVRARYFTYDGGSAEVIHFTQRAEDAVAGWIDTLYHRIPLLHPGMSVFGYGVAGGTEQPVNVALVGPNGGGSGVVRWPHAGQSDVPSLWDGLESPDPLALYPGTAAPVGYPISLTFGGQPRGLRLVEWSLTGAEGEVALLPYDSVRDPQLTDTVAVIPRAPLRAGALYTVRLRGEVDLGQGPQPYAYTWTFRTAEEQRPLLKSRVATVGASGQELQTVRLEGSGFAGDLQLFLGGLPVEGLVRQSDSQLLFRPPQGYRGEEADLLLVTGDGVEVDWPSFFTGGESYRFPTASAFQQVDLVVRGQLQPEPALLHPGGAILLPEGVLERLGATAERFPAIGRTYWSLNGRVGEYVQGRVSASVGQSDLRLALPVQQRLGATYVEAAFARSLAGVEQQMVGAELYVGRRIGGQIDVDGHWAEAAVARLLEAKVVGGYGDGSFRPDATLSRAAFVKMLAGARGLPLRRGEAGGFADAAGHWVAVEGYLGAAVAAGIIRPADYPGGRFEPDRAIAREEMAVMLVRALGLEQSALGRTLPVTGGQTVIGDRTFRDAGEWHQPGHIAEAVRAGIITGYAEADGRYTFRPGQTATRAEAATMVVRALEYR